MWYCYVHVFSITWHNHYFRDDCQCSPIFKTLITEPYYLPFLLWRQNASSGWSCLWRAYNAFHVLLSTLMTIMSIILLISVTCPLAIISRPVTPTSETVPRLCTLPLSYPTVQDLLNVSGWRAGCGFACAAPMSFRGSYFDRFWPFSLYRFEPNALLRLPNLRINYLIPQKLSTIARSC